MKRRVFVVQMPSTKVNGQWRDKYDLTPAEHFGELVEVLPRGNVPSTLGPTLARLRSALADFCDDDYVLAVGDPVAIAAAAMVASRVNGGRVVVLKWDKRAQEYLPYPLDVAGP